MPKVLDNMNVQGDIQKKDIEVTSPMYAHYVSFTINKTVSSVNYRASVYFVMITSDESYSYASDLFAKIVEMFGTLKTIFATGMTTLNYENLGIVYGVHFQQGGRGFYLNTTDTNFANTSFSSSDAINFTDTAIKIS